MSQVAYGKKWIDNVCSLEARGGCAVLLLLYGCGHALGQALGQALGAMPSGHAHIHLLIKGDKEMHYFLPLV